MVLRHREAHNEGASGTKNHEIMHPRDETLKHILPVVRSQVDGGSNATNSLNATAADATLKAGENALVLRALPGNEVCADCGDKGMQNRSRISAARALI